MHDEGHKVFDRLLKFGQHNVLVALVRLRDAAWSEDYRRNAALIDQVAHVATKETRPDIGVATALSQHGGECLRYGNVNCLLDSVIVVQKA